MSKNKLRFFSWMMIPILLLTLIAYFKIDNIPTTLFIREGQKIQSDKIVRLNKVDSKNAKVSLLGIIPVKSVAVKPVDNKTSVYLGGQPVGVKLNTKGVLVVGLCDVEADDGKVQSPAAVSGMQIGDSILKINDLTINCSEDVVKAVNENSDKELRIEFDRKGEMLEKKMKSVKCKKDGNYKIGLWVRDSTAGVGTLTFYDAGSNNYGALGHPITDMDTGVMLSVNNGELVPSTIVNVRKGQRGEPGELKGIFINEDSPIGDIRKNTECGVFGEGSSTMINDKYSSPVRIALRSEIKTGPAKILTTVDGTEPRYYDIVIEKLLAQDKPGPKSMVIRVTDPELLSKTGGIVQGMSGSPIVQDGKLVGAVTHVLVNKPDVGYGIYIEWMLKDAEVFSNK